MKKVITASLAALALGASMNAAAWGDKEQGIVIGIVGTVIGAEILQNHRNHGPHTSHHYPVYTGPAHGGYSQSGVLSAYERGLQQRLENERRRYSIDQNLRTIQDRAEWRAYRCGINPAEC